MSKTKSKKQKNVFRIVLNVIVYTFFVISAVALILSIVAKNSHEGSAELFGRRYMTVLTSSMEKCEETDVSEYEIKDIPVNSLIFIDPVPEDSEEAEAWYADLEKHDVLTFRYFYGTQITITHRIIDIYKNPDGDGYTIILEGDNKCGDTDILTQTIDTSDENSLNYVIGRVTGQNKALGFLITLLKSKVGLICFIIIPSVIIAILEVVRIISVINEKKRNKVISQQEEEMNDLRRQLEELKRQQAESAEQNQPEQNENQQ